MKDYPHKLASEAKPGDASVYIPGQADGAIPNGTRIIKNNARPGDSTPEGTLGTVISSLDVPRREAEAIFAAGKSRAVVKHLYFVEWDDKPGLAVATADDKIGVLNVH